MATMLEPVRTSAAPSPALMKRARRAQEALHASMPKVALFLEKSRDDSHTGTSRADGRENKEVLQPAATADYESIAAGDIAGVGVAPGAPAASADAAASVEAASSAAASLACYQGKYLNIQAERGRSVRLTVPMCGQMGKLEILRAGIARGTPAHDILLGLADMEEKRPLIRLSVDVASKILTALQASWDTKLAEKESGPPAVAASGTQEDDAVGPAGDDTDEADTNALEPTRKKPRPAAACSTPDKSSALVREDSFAKTAGPSGPTVPATAPTAVIAASANQVQLASPPAGTRPPSATDAIPTATTRESEMRKKIGPAFGTWQKLASVKSKNTMPDGSRYFELGANGYTIVAVRGIGMDEGDTASAGASTSPSATILEAVVVRVARGHRLKDGTEVHKPGLPGGRNAPASSTHDGVGGQPQDVPTSGPSAPATPGAARLDGEAMASPGGAPATEGRVAMTEYDDAINGGSHAQAAARPQMAGVLDTTARVLPVAPLRDIQLDMRTASTPSTPFWLLIAPQHAWLTAKGLFIPAESLAALPFHTAELVENSTGGLSACVYAAPADATTDRADAPAHASGRSMPHVRYMPIPPADAHLMPPTFSPGRTGFVTAGNFSLPNDGRGAESAHAATADPHTGDDYDIMQALADELDGRMDDAMYEDSYPSTPDEPPAAVDARTTGGAREMPTHSNVSAPSARAASPALEQHGACATPRNDDPCTGSRGSAAGVSGSGASRDGLDISAHTLTHAESRGPTKGLRVRTSGSAFGHADFPLPNTSPGIDFHFGGTSGSYSMLPALAPMGEHLASPSLPSLSPPEATIHGQHNSHSACLALPDAGAAGACMAHFTDMDMMGYIEDSIGVGDSRFSATIANLMRESGTKGLETALLPACAHAPSAADALRRESQS